MHLRTHAGRVDIGDEHDRIAGQDQLVKNRGHRLVHPDDNPVGAVGESVSHGQDPPYSGRRGRAGHQREYRGEQGDGRQHDRGGDHLAYRVARQHVTVTHGGGGRDRPVQARRQRIVLGGGEQGCPGQQAGHGGGKQDCHVPPVAHAEDADEKHDHADIVPQTEAWRDRICRPGNAGQDASA